MSLRYTKTDFNFSLCTLAVCKWDMEKFHQISICHFVSCFVKNWCGKLTSQSLQHWRKIKPLSVWSSTVTLETGFWMLANHCQNHTVALLWILQKCTPFFRCLWPWILLPLCTVQYLSEKKLEWPWSSLTIKQHVHVWKYWLFEEGLVEMCLLVTSQVFMVRLIKSGYHLGIADLEHAHESSLNFRCMKW